MSNVNFSFPFEGVDKGRAASNQSPTTSPDMRNMRVYDVLGNRARGGQRPGLGKLYSEQIGNAPVPISLIASVTVVENV